MFESEFRAKNSKAGLPIVVLQTDKLCSTAAYDSGRVQVVRKKPKQTKQTDGHKTLL
jgi:hypothetical protein